jgi:predicted exporter
MCSEYEEKVSLYMSQVQDGPQLREAIRSIRFWTPTLTLALMLVASGFIIMVICLSVVFFGL